ncbi:MAG: hypothetical protein CMJ18_18670, partial [Phycisphaeraceae bacterium]|nr:hypothetical protein [Phycisphaeraceae bacterium]
PGDRVFASSSYGVGCALFQVGHEAGAWSIDRTWKRMTLKAKFTNTVLHEGFIYGLDESVLVCLDPETGRRRWKKGRYGHGQVLLVPPWLLVVAESGEVALVEASPDQLVERARFQAITGKTWNHPALAGRFLLVRNDREAACYELPVEEDSGG